MARKQAEKLDGYFASIVLKDEIHIKCRLKKWAPGEIKVCINCNLAPSWLYNLQCPHKLCQACFRWKNFYVCPMDNITSEQYQVTSTTTFNSGLIMTILECPLCSTDHGYWELKEHLETAHPQILYKLHPNSPHNTLSKRPSAIGPPPGFGGHVLPFGRETGETPEAIDQPAGDENRGKKEDPSSGISCTYCAVSVKSDEIQEHLEHCLGIFLQWKCMILNTVSHNCQENEPDCRTKFLGHISTCPTLDLECRRSFILMIRNYSRKHRSDHCSPSKPGLSSFQEHIDVCTNFSAKCSEIIGRVVDKYRRDHSSNACPEMKKRAGIPEAEVQTNEDANVADLCPNCFVLLKIEDVADHIDNCPRLLECEKCSSRVRVIDYSKHLDEQCPATKKTNTSCQVDDTKGHGNLSTPASLGSPHPAQDLGAGSHPCPYCEALWDISDLEEHIKNCKRDHIRTPSGRMNRHQPVNTSFQERKPRTRSVKEIEPHRAEPKEQHYDIEDLKTKVEVHQKSCAPKTKVECPLCKSLHDRKTLVIHMGVDCPKRVVECKFCQSDVEAWEKEIHEGTCRYRPGTCQYCQKQFTTIIQLEEQHHPECPKMAVKCSFYPLGCSFSAARCDVITHEETTKHTDLLVEHVRLLKAENESLKQTIENQEKKFNSIIENIKDSLAKLENRKNIAFERHRVPWYKNSPFGINPYSIPPDGEQASAAARRWEIEARLADVEKQLSSYQWPFEQLLERISELK